MVQMDESLLLAPPCPVPERSQFCPVVQGDVPHQKRFFVPWPKHAKTNRFHASTMQSIVPIQSKFCIFPAFPLPSRPTSACTQDAILTGCLPVVVTFKSHVKGYVSWWLPGGPPVERMVPFWDAIDYRSFVVEVPESQAALIAACCLGLHQ